MASEILGQKEMEKDPARRRQEMENQLIAWLVRDVWQMLKEYQIFTRLMRGVLHMLTSICENILFPLALLIIDQKRL